MSRATWAWRAWRPALLTCAVAAQAVALQLTVRTPFVYDDAANQNIKGYIAAQHQGFWDFMWTMINGQWHAIGRFIPLGLIENYGLHYLVHDRIGYKLILVVLTIAAVLSVARVLIVLSVPVEIAVLGAALTAALYQLRLYHDALQAYAGLMQLVTLVYCGSLLLFIGWLRGGGWWRLALSMLLVLVADLAYEAAYLLVILHVTVAVAERRRALAAAGPVAVGVAFVVLTYYLRVTQLGSGSQYSISTDPGKVLPALGKQLSAPFPASNFLDPGGPKVLPDSGSAVPEVRGVLIGLLLLPVLWAAGRVAATWHPSRRLLSAVVLLCACFLLLPSGLVALALRYQAELRWGVGYLPVFFGVVGLAILGALAYAAAARRLPVLPLAAVCAVALGALAAINAEGNTRVVSSLEPVAQARDQLDDVITHGLLDTTPSNRLLLFDAEQIAPPAGFWLSGYAMDMGQWIYTHTGRTRRTAVIGRASPFAKQCLGPSAPCLVLEGPVTWFTTGKAGSLRWVLLTPLRSDRVGPSTNLYAASAAAHARLAVRSTPALVVVSTVAQWARRKDGKAVTSRGAALRVVARHGRWTMLDVEVPRGVTAASGVVVPPTP